MGLARLQNGRTIIMHSMFHITSSVRRPPPAPVHEQTNVSMRISTIENAALVYDLALKYYCNEKFFFDRPIGAL